MKNIADDLVSAFNDGYKHGYEDAKAKRKRGKWDYIQWMEGITEIWTYECSECGYKLQGNLCYNRPNFCPDCGADMRGES